MIINGKLTAEPEVQSAINTLFSNLETTNIPDTLVSFTMPEQYPAVPAGLLSPVPQELLIHKIRGAIRPYGLACYGSREWKKVGNGIWSATST